jgi:hypothetical protein
MPTSVIVMIFFLSAASFQSTRITHHTHLTHIGFFILTSLHDPFLFRCQNLAYPYNFQPLEIFLASLHVMQLKFLIALTACHGLVKALPSLKDREVFPDSGTPDFNFNAQPMFNVSGNWTTVPCISIAGPHQSGPEQWAIAGASGS